MGSLVPGEFDLRDLFAALDAERKTRGLSWHGLAAEIGATAGRVAASTLKGLGERSRAEADGVLQVLLWLDRSPESFVAGSRNLARHRLSRPARGKILRWDMVATHAAMDAARIARGITWQQVADEIGGFTGPMLARFAQGGRTSFPGIMRVVRWLDVPANSLLRASDR